MNLTDYVIIVKKFNKQKNNKKRFFKPFIIVNNKEDLYKEDSEWFLNFINNKKDKNTIYFNCNNIDFKFTDKINEIDEKLWDQFERDVTRCNFSIYNNKIMNTNLLKHTLLKLLKNNYNQFNIICFLCSQSSLAFIINSIHQSILNSKKNYIIAELSDKKKDKKKMSILLNIKHKTVIITKYLRIIAINDQGNAITIKSIKLTLNFKINIINQINSIITIDILN